ncbi:CpsD/CapB family tyrosine-protein kinase [Psychrobacillus psychrodurans]|uniref:non-specific protein-tyrosine kinase n=1 Tax=Psychrobacillus psychrodurans TaxID=126157 RepID=A0A9X3L8D8_9BACI|nr:CpsD/CapB family tyrosine-protein kinase [Psychrobacillus psychrodurans]MCZ8533287.1 CpsD/CapB family tyrosine-protein kinase [Psychrobacillus psychrodurans]
MKQIATRKLVTSVAPTSIISEQFRKVRTNINFSMVENKLQTLLFTSTSIGEGKSTIAANVGIVFAQEGKKVLLVDADLRKPTMHYTFHKPNSPGLTNLLSSHCSLDQVVKESGINGLYLITCGPIPFNPAELLSSTSMDIFIKEVRAMYDIIIFDAPPTLSVSDAQILSNKCDGTILVISSGEAEKIDVLKAKEALLSSKANIIGTILNNYKIDKNHYYYQYYG